MKYLILILTTLLQSCSTLKLQDNSKNINWGTPQKGLQLGISFERNFISQKSNYYWVHIKNISNKQIKIEPFSNWFTELVPTNKKLEKLQYGETVIGSEVNLFILNPSETLRFRKKEDLAKNAIVGSSYIFKVSFENRRSLKLVPASGNSSIRVTMPSEKPKDNVCTSETIVTIKKK